VSGRAEASAGYAGGALVCEPPATTHDEDEGDGERDGNVAAGFVITADEVTDARQRSERGDVGEVGTGERGGVAGGLVPRHDTRTERRTRGAREAADEKNEE
jgi:hypothetical protein